MEFLGDMTRKWDRRHLDRLNLSEVKEFGATESVWTTQLRAAKGDIHRDVIKQTAGELTRNVVSHSSCVFQFIKAVSSLDCEDKMIA